MASTRLWGVLLQTHTLRLITERAGGDIRCASMRVSGSRMRAIRLSGRGESGVSIHPVCTLGIHVCASVWDHDTPYNPNPAHVLVFVHIPSPTMLIMQMGERVRAGDRASDRCIMCTGQLCIHLLPSHRSMHPPSYVHKFILFGIAGVGIRRYPTGCANGRYFVIFDIVGNC